VIYLNNAATSHPKPARVVAAVMRSLTQPPREAGRSSGGGNALEDLRQSLARLFNVARPDHIALLPSATYALNLVIQGLARPGSHVITSCYEHNSVLRPLYHLRQRQGIEVTYLTPEECTVEKIDAALTGHLRDTTSLIVLTHVSNVTGAVLDVRQVARIAAQRGIPVVIDGAQGAGTVPVDHRSLPGTVYYCFAGHKVLMGPAGTGGVVLPDDRLPQMIFGGTGVLSVLENHPETLPLRHEAGTPNHSGFEGLLEGVRFLQEDGVSALYAYKKELIEHFVEGSQGLPRVRLVPNLSDTHGTGIVSFYLEGASPQEMAMVLSDSFGIEVRAGLHCAPLVNGALGLPARGTLRVSTGAFTTHDEIDSMLGALGALSSLM